MADTLGSTNDSYSPFLADLLDIDTTGTKNITLSEIGRRVYGSNADYAAKKRAVDEARQAMEGALAERKGGFRLDPKMLKLAQGFLAPTQTGSFGESLSTAAGAYAEAQLAEDQRLRDLARMRYELAQGALAEEKELAGLGLKVASKITPTMTAIQKQILSEGINPRSPEGMKRSQELYALTQATPEMKEFSARTGIALTSPTFSSAFQQNKSLESLRPIATRLGLDLNDPTQLAQAREEFQRETMRTRKPEVVKMLDTFGGDILNEQDVIRAEKMLQADRERMITKQNLDAKSVKTTIDRTQQEINENTRSGNYAILPDRAAQMGVPVDPQTKLKGLSVKEAATQRSKDVDEAEKYISDKLKPYLEGADEAINNLTRAQALNEQIRTGVTYGVPFVGGAAKMLSGDKKLIDEFEALAAAAAKENRMPGDSNVSNADLKFMQLGAFSIDKQPEANKMIIQFKLAQKQRDKEMAEFFVNYAAVNGVIGPNTMAAWREYVDANPLMYTDKNTGQVILNPHKMSYKEYFSAPRVKIGKDGKEQR